MKMHARVRLILSWFVCCVVATAWALGADDADVLWSLRPVRSIVPPVSDDSHDLNSAVDSFIAAKLNGRNLRFAPLADHRTLIRRATFDLTGLPPTPAEIDSFLADDSPDAFAKVVDRLLASRTYGERWGRHWLDVVRYADARDLIQLPVESDFREAWRYRDWVVNAFNRDLPYDQFLMQQVAGDLMQPADPGRIDADALVATGLLAIADFVPGDVDKQQMIADYVNDQIDVVGRAILGMTLACARCHDHKFDPISIEDYYSLAGIFFSSRLIPGPVKGNTPLVKAPLLPATEIAAIEAEKVRDKARIGELQSEISRRGERDYRLALERRVEMETQQYLLAGWQYRQTPAGQERPAVNVFAKSAGLDATTLGRWLACLEARSPHPSLKEILDAPDQHAADAQSKLLARQIADLATAQRALNISDSVVRTLSDSAMIHLRATIGD